jgi:hypothetical protein
MADLAAAIAYSRTRTITYWVTTVILATEYVVGGICDARAFWRPKKE